MEQEEKEEEAYEDWYNENQEDLFNDFLLNNKEFDRICREAYENQKEE